MVLVGITTCDVLLQNTMDCRFNTTLLQSFECDFKGRFLEFQLFHNFADFYLNCWKAPVTSTLIRFTKSIKLKVLYKSFFEGFPNSASHTS